MAAIKYFLQGKGAEKGLRWEERRKDGGVGGGEKDEGRVGGGEEGWGGGGGWEEGRKDGGGEWEEGRRIEGGREEGGREVGSEGEVHQCYCQS